VNRLSCLWHRKGPQERGHAHPETHLRDLRARVVDLCVHFVVEPVGAPAIEAAVHYLGASVTEAAGVL